MSAVPRAVRHGVALSVAALYPESVERLRLGTVVFLIIENLWFWGTVAFRKCSRSLSL